MLKITFVSLSLETFTVKLILYTCSKNINNVFYFVSDNIINKKIKMIANSTLILHNKTGSTDIIKVKKNSSIPLYNKFRNNAVIIETCLILFIIFTSNNTSQAAPMSRGVAKYCGTDLPLKLKELCSATGYPSRFKRATGYGIVDECCKQPCSNLTLLSYCNNNSIQYR